MLYTIKFERYSSDPCNNLKPCLIDNNNRPVDGKVFVGGITTEVKFEGTLMSVGWEARNFTGSVFFRPTHGGDQCDYFLNAGTTPLTYGPFTTNKIDPPFENVLWTNSSKNDAHWVHTYAQGPCTGDLNADDGFSREFHKVNSGGFRKYGFVLTNFTGRLLLDMNGPERGYEAHLFMDNFQWDPASREWVDYRAQVAFEAFRKGVASLVIDGGVMLAGDRATGDLHQYNFEENTWTVVAPRNPQSPPAQFCTDGVGLWSLSADRKSVWSWPGPRLVKEFSEEIRQIVVVKGIVYVLMSNGLVNSIAADTSLLCRDVSAITGGSDSLFVLSSYPGNISEYADGELKQTIDPTGLGGNVSTIVSVGRAMVATSPYTEKVLLVDTAADSAGSTVVDGFSGVSSFALTAAGLVGVGRDTVQLYDSETKSWSIISQLPSGMEIFGGGDLPYGLDAGGTLYRLTPPPPPAAAPLLESAAAGEVSGARNYSRWMTDLATQKSAFKTRRLDQLCLPGTHDSGCSRFSNLITGPICKTQEVDIATQLARGARVFDIRPRWKTGDKDFYIFHDKYPSKMKLSDALRQFQAFGVANPGELVIVYFNHLGDVVKSGGTMAAFNQMVADLLPRTAPRTMSPASTYQDFVSAGKNVIAVADGFSHSTQFWDASTIEDRDKWADTSVVPKLHSFIEKRLKAHDSSSTGLWMLQCQLTPSAVGFFMATSPITRWVINGSPKQTVTPIQLAGVSKGPVLKQLNPATNAAAQHRLNLFIVDDYTTDWTDLATQTNLAR